MIFQQGPIHYQYATAITLHEAVLAARTNPPPTNTRDIPNRPPQNPLLHQPKPLHMLQTLKTPPKPIFTEREQIRTPKRRIFIPRAELYEQNRISGHIFVPILLNLTHMPVEPCIHLVKALVFAFPAYQGPLSSSWSALPFARAMLM
ncbi:hypothetical protein EG328_001242 [Venturia inaequalis]|uniref:Uncharacterized protein n=1 Tax=Venturia inaequalis TaxID=5025 RepID=A0A8H3V0F2_VENIN|nr:hypothetical protein EG328_001242 [Venturia inaequalis]